MVNPMTQTTYKSSVINIENLCKFQVVAEDDPTNPIIANSATGAWTTVVKAANKIRNKEHSNSASGPDYFGFTQPTIRKLIQGF